MKIISGGQIGVDIAALRAAKQLGFETGGFMPYGFRTINGRKPEYEEMYGMVQTNTVAYPPRTRLNVEASDGTLRIARYWHTRGEKCTLNAIMKCGKPSYDLDYEDVEAWLNKRSGRTTIVTWILENNIQILNVAGNALIFMEVPVQKFLVSMFQENKDRLAPPVESV